MNIRILILCLSILCANSMISQSYNPTTVKTPKGSTVTDTGILTSSDITYSTAQIASLREYLQSQYNGAILVDVPSFAYNCHAYAWHVSEGGNKVWIGLNGSKAEDVYWTDGSYYEVPENEATKVSYHESGNHSAIRLSSEWYQSKWGSSALVKHHPNDVPLGYNPSMTKKFYKKLPSMMITGQSYICSFADYSVSNLPVGATVNWTYSPIYSSTRPSIKQNTPSKNSCTVNNTYGQIFEGYLNAEIIYAGKIIDTVSRLIRGDNDNFVGFYWQPSSDGSWVPDMSISLDEPNIAIPPNDVIIESDNFRGKRITYSALGYTGVLQSSASNRVSFEMLDLPSGELMTIRVDGSDCSSPIIFTFKSQNYSKTINDRGLAITSLGANRYNISVAIPETTDISDDDSNHDLSIATEATNWSLELRNVMNSQKMMEQNVVGNSYILDMSTMNSGIYVVTARIGEKVYSGKICK